MKLTVLITTFLSSLLFFSCSKKDVEKEAAFIKIYDNKAYTQNYVPIDLKQRSDGSYIILAKQKTDTSQFFSGYILRVDKDGKFISENYIAPPYINPVEELLQSGDSLYLVCMGDTTFKGRLLKIDMSGTASEVAGLSEEMPLRAALTADKRGFLLLSYNRYDFKMVVSRLNFQGTGTKSEFDVSTSDYDPRVDIYAHFNGSGKQIPFLIGERPEGGVFYNGFYNYSMTLVFLNSSLDKPSTFSYGERVNKYATSAIPLGGGQYAVSRYGYGEAYFMPKIAFNGISILDKQEGKHIPELEDNSRVVTKLLTIEGKEVVIYGATSKSKQVVLYTYEKSTGNLIASKHIGFSFPLVMGNFILNNDQTITIVATNYIAGRLPRVSLIKLSKKETKELVGIYEKD